MSTRPHQSGFGEIEGRETPMRVSRIIDQIHIKLELSNFIPVVFTICQIVTRDFPRANNWSAADVTHDVLNYIAEFEPLNFIFLNSTEFMFRELEKRNRVCNSCFTS
jgi:hypothetical protein